MRQIFSNCSSLINLPNISKWNTAKVKGIARMFAGCKSLLNIPDISIWKTSNVINMSGMFYDCSSLLSTPDISKWDKSNAKDIDEIFKGYSFSQISFPDSFLSNNKDKSNSNKITTSDCCNTSNKIDNNNKDKFAQNSNSNIILYNLDLLDQINDENTENTFYDDFYNI